MSGLQFALSDATSRRADATNWSTTTTATELETKGCRALIVSTPTPLGAAVYVAPDDMADGQQLLVVNNTAQAINVMDSYAQGVSVAWSQNNTTFNAVASGAAQNFVFYIDAAGDGHLILA